MVSLRKDPHGKKVFGESCSSDIAVTTMSSKGESSKIFQLESKIKNLEKELKTSHRVSCKDNVYMYSLALLHTYMLPTYH